MKYEKAMETLQKIEERKKMRYGGFTIAFGGVFSSGKSSILNALLDYKEFSLPVGNFPITKLITRIRYGDSLHFYDSGGNGRARREISREEFELFVTGRKEPSADCSEIEVMMPAKILKTGVIFLDTPGFLDEMGGRLEELSRAAIFSSDFVVLCTSASQLGNQFEKEYIAELEESMGNYCMVVNHMDCCNTKEDEKDIEEIAGRLMEGKGCKLLSGLCGKNRFFTTAAGAYKTMNGFDSCIAYLLENEQLKLVIRKSTDEKITTFQKKELMKGIHSELEKLRAELDSLVSRHSKIILEKTYEQNMKRYNTEQERKRQISLYESEMTYEAGIIERELKKLREQNVISEFVQKAKECIQTRILPIAYKADREMYCPDAPTETCFHFHKEIDNLKVPEPQKTAVKNREIVGQTIVTALNFLFLNFEVDDGYDYVYQDYHTPAVEAVKTKLLPALSDCIRKKVCRFYRMPDDKLVSGLEEDIRECKKLIAKWEAAKRETI